jgi:hypothetical protein
VAWRRAPSSSFQSRDLLTRRGRAAGSEVEPARLQRRFRPGPNREQAPLQRSQALNWRFSAQVQMYLLSSVSATARLCIPRRYRSAHGSNRLTVPGALDRVLPARCFVASPHLAGYCRIVGGLCVDVPCPPGETLDSTMNDAPSWWLCEGVVETTARCQPAARGQRFSLAAARPERLAAARCSQDSCRERAIDLTHRHTDSRTGVHARQQRERTLR